MTGEPAGDNAADITFADALIAQDQQAIDVAMLVPSRSTNAKVLAFATTSASVRRSETSVLKVLEVQWNAHQDSPNGQRNEVPAKGLIDQPTIAKLQSLHGAPFETLWLQSMIDLDAASIQAANAEIAGGKNVDAVDVAKQIAAARPVEIDQMKRFP